MALVGASVGILFRDAAAPQNVVGDEQAALAQARRDQAQHARIVVFVDIVEDDVELLLLFGKKFQRVAGVQA